MNVIAKSDVNVRVWTDPLVDMHIEEFEACASGIATAASLVGIADHLCEMSRDLLYRLDQVTREQLQHLIGAFRDAVVQLRQRVSAGDAAGDAERVGRLINHIEKRIELLERL